MTGAKVLLNENNFYEHRIKYLSLLGACSLLRELTTGINFTYKWTKARIWLTLAKMTKDLSVI